MNKTLIVVLAICLISVQAFVKREAENNANGVDAIKKQLEDLAGSISEQAKQVLNPDNIQKQLNEALDAIKKAADSIAPKAAPKE